MLVLTATSGIATQHRTANNNLSECAYEKHTRFNANTVRRKRNGRCGKRDRGERWSRRGETGSTAACALTSFSSCFSVRSSVCPSRSTFMESTVVSIQRNFFLYIFIIVSFTCSGVFLSRYLTVEHLSRVSRVPLVHLLRFRHSLGANNRTAIPS